MANSTPIRHLSISLAVMGLSGCLTHPPLESIPVTTADFSLPPEEIKTTYPEIRKYDTQFGEASLAYPPVEQLIEAWGEPDAISEQTREHYLAAAGGGLFFLNSPVLMASLFTIGVFSTDAPRQYQWKKENYHIDVIVRKQQNADFVDSWQWRHISANRPPAALFSEPRYLPFFNFSIATGKEHYGERIRDLTDFSSGHGWQLGFGFTINNLLKRTDLDLGIGIKYNELYDIGRERTAVKLTRYPMDITAMYETGKRLRFGGGLAYYHASQFYSVDTGSETMEPATGTTLLVDYSISGKYVLGLRLESLKEKTSTGRRIDGSNLSVRYNYRLFY